MPMADWPRTSYEANLALGQRSRLRLDANTYLVRNSEVIDELYGRGEMRSIITFEPDGSIVLPMRLGERAGESRRGICTRVGLVLPPNWTIYSRSSRFNRAGFCLRLSYRAAYHIDIGSGRLAFLPNGNLRYAGYNLSMDDVEQQAREALHIAAPVTGDMPPPLPDWVGQRRVPPMSDLRFVGFDPATQAGAGSLQFSLRSVAVDPATQTAADPMTGQVYAVPPGRGYMTFAVQRDDEY